MTKKEKEARTRRRAHIRRGMKIALYEVNQILAPHGIHIHFPDPYLHYTVAIAEGNRRDATTDDWSDAAGWELVRLAASRGYRVSVSR